MKAKLPLALAALVMFCGFGWFKNDKKAKSAPPQSIQAQDLPSGYALLFKLLSDEKDVSKLLIIKHGDPAFRDLVKDISATARDAHASLENLGKATGMNLEQEHLPAVESAVRESISKEKAKQLLGSKGQDFEYPLLLSQNEALTYGRHLALVLCNAQPRSAQTDSLAALAARFTELQDRVLAMLRAEAPVSAGVPALKN